MRHYPGCRFAANPTCKSPQCKAFEAGAYSMQAEVDRLNARNDLSVRKLCVAVDALRYSAQQESFMRVEGPAKRALAAIMEVK